MLFVLVAATAGLADEGSSCDAFLTLGDGNVGSVYLTAALDLFEESNGLPGLQRGCPGDPLVAPDRPAG